MSVVFTLKILLVWVFYSVVMKKVKMVHWMFWVFPFPRCLVNWVITVLSERTLEYISNMIWCWRFFSNTDYFFLISSMCLIWFNMYLFSWRLVLKISLSLQAVMTCTLLYFPVGCWLEMASKTCLTFVGSFLPMLRIQIFVLFLAINAWFHGLLFVDWKIYEMFWCSQYCATTTVGVPLCSKLILASNISSLMKWWYYGSILMLEGWNYLYQA